MAAGVRQGEQATWRERRVAGGGGGGGAPQQIHHATRRTPANAWWQIVSASHRTGPGIGCKRWPGRGETGLERSAFSSGQSATAVHDASVHEATR